MSQRDRVKSRMKAFQSLKYATELFNDKIEKLRISNPESIEYLPNYVSMEKLYREMELVPTREIYNRERSLRRFLEGGAEMPYTTMQGVKITVWEKDEIDRQFDRINERRQSQMSKYEPSYFKGTGTAIKRENLNRRPNTLQKIEPKQFDVFRENLYRSYLYSNEEVRAEYYKSNFLSAVNEQFGSESTLYKYLEDFDAVTLYRGAFNNPFLQIDFVYDPNEAPAVMEKIYSNLVELE